MVTCSAMSICLFCNISCTFSHKFFPQPSSRRGIIMQKNEYCEPTYVMRFGSSASEEDICWVLERMRADNEKGGAGLIVKCLPPKNNQQTTALLTISPERRPIVATAMHLKKADLKGRMSCFSDERIEDFVSKDNHDSFFSSADTLMMIRREINHTRSKSQEKLPSGLEFFHGQSIVEKLIQAKIIDHLSPLHQKENLDKLEVELRSHRWAMFTVPFNPPLESARRYFGDGIAVFFAFLQTITIGLTLITTLGIIQYFLQPLSFNVHLIFCAIYLMIGFCMMEYWQRRHRELVYYWSLLTHEGDNAINTEPRAKYQGELQTNPVTGELQPYYPKWKTVLKICTVSLPLFGSIIVLCFSAMLEAISKEYELDRNLQKWANGNLWKIILSYALLSVFDLIYIAVVSGINFFYRKLADYMTEWENHRNESQFQSHFMLKVLPFEIINQFLLPCYIAFYMWEAVLLQRQLTVLLLVPIILDKSKQNAIYYYRKYFSKKPAKTENEPAGTVNLKEPLIPKLKQLKIDIITDEDPRLKQAESDFDLDSYVGLNKGYLQLLAQFGLALMFIVVNPLAGVCSLFGLFLFWRLLALRMTCVYQRPEVDRVTLIGTWGTIFCGLCYMAAITNCGLVYIAHNLDSSPDSRYRAVLCMGVSQLLLAVRALMQSVIPKTPEALAINLAKDDRHLDALLDEE